MAFERPMTLLNVVPIELAQMNRWLHQGGMHFGLSPIDYSRNSTANVRFAQFD
jgi:hypothetical protein